MSISEKTPFRLRLETMVVVALSLLGAGGTFAIARADVASLKEEVRDLRQRTANNDAGVSGMREELRAVQENQKFQTQLLQEMKQDLKEMRRR